MEIGNDRSARKAQRQEKQIEARMNAAKAMEISADDSDATKATKTKNRKAYEEKIANAGEDYSDSYSMSDDGNDVSSENEGADAHPPTPRDRPTQSTPIEQGSAEKARKGDLQENDEEMQEVENSPPPGQRTPESNTRRKQRGSTGIQDPRSPTIDPTQEWPKEGNV